MQCFRFAVGKPPTKIHPKKAILYFNWNFNLDFLNPYVFNYFLSFPDFYSSLSSVTFSKGFNFPINSLPHSVTFLAFGDDFNHHLPPLPNSLTHISFGRSFNRLIDSLPSALTHLSFGSNFNQPLHSILPRSLVHLKLGMFFNHHLPSLPHLTHLHFADYSYCNQTLPHFTSITHLRLHHNDGPLYYLPTTLTYLHLTMDIDVKIDRLPKSLTHLILRFLFRNPKPVTLPPNLTHLSFGNSLHPTVICDPVNTCTIVHHFPSSLVSLNVGKHFSAPLLPPHLKYFTSFDDMIPFNQFYAELTHLIIPYCSSFPSMSHPPPSLTYLELKYLNGPISHLTGSLTHLFVRDIYWVDDLPPKLTHLACGRLASQRENLTWPSSLHI